MRINISSVEPTDGGTDFSITEDADKADRKEEKVQRQRQLQ
jgi:hypothetical protein